MESGGIQALITPLPGQRISDKENPDDGSVLAYRKDGEECLFASWNAEEPQGMIWIPIGEFSPDPEAIQPPDIVQENEEGQPDNSGTTESAPSHGPMGGRQAPRLPRRPGVEG